MTGINSIKMDGYRGLNKIELTDMSYINLLVGNNNSGKTSILEAIHLMSTPASEHKFKSLARMRETSVYPMLKNITNLSVTDSVY